MGYLTTITISNDGADQIEKHPEEFAKKAYNACTGLYTRDKNKTGGFGVGCHSNMVIVQKPRHADDHTIYVHMGNTVVEMNSYSDATEDLMKNHSEYFEDLLKYMQFQVKDLKRKYKEIHSK